MNYYTIHCDRETSERAGAGRMFQVSGIWDADGEDVTSLIDVDKHYSSFIEVKQDMALKLGSNPFDIDLDEV
jgi:hypothetical protein